MSYKSEGKSLRDDWFLVGKKNMFDFTERFAVAIWLKCIGFMNRYSMVRVEENDIDKYYKIFNIMSQF